MRDWMVTLERVGAQDRERLLAWRNRPEVAQWMYTDHEITADEHARWFETAIVDPTQRHWIVLLRGEPVGAVNLVGVSREQARASWGIYIAEPSARGTGAASRAVFLSLDAAFGELGLERVTCEAIAGNDRAIRLYERMGFRREGLLRSHVRRRDERLDVVTFAVLASEWATLRDALDGQTKERVSGEGPR